MSIELSHIITNLQKIAISVIDSGKTNAQRVALALDRCGWPEIVGNVGGDDTVFTATSSGAAQRNLLARIKRAAART